MSQPSAAEQPAFTRRGAEQGAVSDQFNSFQQLMTLNSAAKVASAEARLLESTRFEHVAPDHRCFLEAEHGCAFC
jgi:hypothetical protein